jgi:hypothetical protein
VRGCAALLGVLGISVLLACDSFIADRLVVTTSSGGPGSESTAIALEVVRESLRSSGLRREVGEGTLERWTWRDREHPPGLEASITASRGTVTVELLQDPYGSARRTKKYLQVRQVLSADLELRYGRANVRLE